MTPEQFTELKTDLAVIKHQLGSIDIRLVDHEDRLRVLETTKADRTELNGFGERLKPVEDNQTDHAQAVRNIRKYSSFTLVTLIGLLIATAFERLFL